MNRRIIRTAPVTPGAVPTAAVWTFRERIERAGEHRLWTGTADKGTTPVHYHDNIRYPARPLAWLLHHGTEPVGLVKAGCGVNLCVHGPHLTDDVTRQRERILYALLHGVTLAGPCTAGLHDLAEYGYVRPTGKTECRGCANARRNPTTHHEDQEGALAA
ncbi:hypothetical protein [Streptomyces sp. Ag109_O5-1]|uniref:hypothetical protein n=1 Tax=Streptomyces sp. Ag109_O5-1 TaxID=1938851 RepID=UPI000F4FAE43|nr:hypothetical protein [Streptomyces sp. Ag109_O5-1]